MFQMDVETFDSIYANEDSFLSKGSKNHLVFPQSYVHTIF